MATIYVEREPDEPEEEFPPKPIFKKEGGTLWLRYKRDGDYVVESTKQKDMATAKKMLKKRQRAFSQE